MDNATRCVWLADDDARASARCRSGADAGIAWHFANGHAVRGKAARAQAGKHAVRRKLRRTSPQPETVSAKSVTPEPAPVRSEPAIAESAEISPGDRLKIQSALLWSGDYTGSIGGEDPFLSAIKNYQKRAKSKITGILSPSERRTCSPPQKLTKMNSAGQS